MALDKKDKQQIEKSFSRQVRVIGEDFRAQIKPIAEEQKVQGKKFDALYEMVAKNTVDIEIIKSDTSFIKHSLKRKIDIDEFNALEKRVILLERKFKRV